FLSRLLIRNLLGYFLLRSLLRRLLLGNDWSGSHFNCGCLLARLLLRRLLRNLLGDLLCSLRGRLLRDLLCYLLFRLTCSHGSFLLSLNVEETRCLYFAPYFPPTSSLAISSPVFRTPSHRARATSFLAALRTS